MRPVARETVPRAVFLRNHPEHPHRLGSPTNLYENSLATRGGMAKPR